MPCYSTTFIFLFLKFVLPAFSHTLKKKQKKCLFITCTWYCNTLYARFTIRLYVHIWINYFVKTSNKYVKHCTHTCTYGSCKITIFRMNMPAKYFFPWMHLPILLLQLLITNVSCIFLTSQKPFRTFRFSSPCKFSGNAKNKVSTESTPSSHIAFAHEKKLNINNLVIIGIKEDQMVGRHLEEVPKHSQYESQCLVQKHSTQQ